MIPARVIGRIVPARMIESLAGVPVLLVQPVDADLKDFGVPMAACDAIGANEGEYVFMAQGREAGMPLPVPVNPADLTIISIVDTVTS